MSLVCPKCNTSNVNEANFCKNCGVNIAEGVKQRNESEQLRKREEEERQVKQKEEARKKQAEERQAKQRKEDVQSKMATATDAEQNKKQQQNKWIDIVAPSIAILLLISVVLIVILLETPRTQDTLAKNEVVNNSHSVLVPASILSKKDLQWQDDESVKTNQFNWHGAISHCDALSLYGHNDWRLPTRLELLSITDITKHNPAIKEDFSYIASTYYWSGSPDVSGTSYAWVVNFDGGNGLWGAKSSSYYVRCVRESKNGV